MNTESKSNVTSAKRFAIFLPHLFGGGAERAMVNLAHGLLDRGFKVDLVLGLKKGPYLSNVRPEVNIIDLGTNEMWPKVKGLAKYMKEYQPRGLVSSLDNINAGSLDFDLPHALQHLSQSDSLSQNHTKLGHVRILQEERGRQRYALALKSLFPVRKPAHVQ